MGKTNNGGVINLINFVRESNQIEGITRVLTYEIKAHKKLLALSEITIPDLEAFVATIAQGAVLRRQVGLDVRVANHVAPRGGPDIEIALGDILGNIKHGRKESYATHLRYEYLHPFTDGNGRSGRVLWLWQRRGEAPLGFLHHFYYDTLDATILDEYNAS